MADLEGAAHAAVVTLKALAEMGQEAEDALASLEERLGAVKAQLEADAGTLEGARKDFSIRVADEKARLQDGGSEAEQALVAAHESTSAAREEAHQELGDAHADLSSLGTALQDAPSQIDDALAELGTASHALVDRARAIETALAQAFESARAFVEDEMVPELAAMCEAVDARAAAAREELATSCPVSLQAAYDHWLATLDEVEALVGGAFEQARDHVQQVVDYALEEGPRRHLAALESLQPLVEGLETTAAALQSALAEMEVEVQEARESTTREADATGAGAEAAAGALAQLGALLAQFSFGQA
jgi:chromosome segregation ATPase